MRTGKGTQMQLCLVRHASADNTGQNGITRDSQRRLSQVGRAEAAIVATFLAAEKWIPVRVTASPLVRAMETAGIIAARLDVKEGALSLDILEPGVSAPELAAYMKASRVQRLLAVGHMPDCTEITAEFIGRKNNTGLAFEKAAAALITFDDEPEPGTGRLEWLLQPLQMRQQLVSGPRSPGQQ